MLTRLIVVLALFTALCQSLGCSTGQARSEEPQFIRDGSPEHLRDMLSGSFNSRAQSIADPKYFDISLHMTPIWTARSDGPWLYVEQARSDTPDQPYRQRVYRIRTQPDGRLASEVYTLPDPVSRFVGAYQGEALGVFQTLSPQDLKQLDGCAVLLKWSAADRTYSGGTEGEGCVSNRAGAAYATSRVTLTDSLLVSWDRGFDTAGRQVWGATAGGYRFERQQP